MWFPLILASAASTETVTLGVHQFIGQCRVNWSAVLASLSLAILPVLGLYVVFSRQPSLASPPDPSGSTAPRKRTPGAPPWPSSPCAPSGSPTARVVHEVDLDVADGELVVFIGPSGCGKSTLLRMIAGREPSPAGRRSSAGHPAPWRLELGLIPCRAGAKEARPMSDWPSIPYAPWAGTCAALHLWTQIAGKHRLAHTPWVNHSWHATLYATPRGLTTGPIPDPGGVMTLTLDLADHALVAEGSGGAREGFALEPMSVANFLAHTREAVEGVGGTFAIHGAPNEVPEPVPFEQDTATRPYDREAVERFHAALLRIVPVMERFRTGFLGKVSPVHLFWGSFDLAVTRFSGRRAPLHPGGFPGLPDAVTREAYSHEVSSAGFWPGGNGVEEAMFYSYAYPVPEGFAARPAEPEAARFDEALGEFVLPYEAVRTSPDPEAALTRFLESTYEAAADTAAWDRAALDCETGRPGVPRAVHAGA